MNKMILNIMMVIALLVSISATAQTTCPADKQMSIGNNMTVGEMAVQEPKAITIYKELGIDYCCLGDKNLKNALKEKTVSPEAFLKKLEVLKKEPDKNPAVNYVAMTPEALAGYIVNTHHNYLWKSLPETSALFEKVLQVHGANHAELFEAYKLFGTMKTDLEQHLIKEETMLFPKIENLNDPEVKKIATAIKEEHEQVAELMEQLRSVTHDYALPEDACASYKSLYASMQAIEEDIHQHIHLENNILLKNSGS